MSANWTPPTEAVEAAARAMHCAAERHFSWGETTEFERGLYQLEARAALIAAHPVLVAEALAAERERIAQAIEAARPQPSWPGNEYREAARIARNGARA